MSEIEHRTPAGLMRRLGIWDLALAALVLAVIVMLVVPLTQWLLDLLISLNLCLSITVFTTALFIRRPLGFTVLPTVLLVATLFRLALNVSSTRLILLEADAGQVIRAFSTVLVGGDILVGAVVFGILALVMFLVITKGAERVAEVAARFTLDALPGMQVAIDADLRSGAIGPREVARRRDDLDRRSHYFGALDGAMKFVRGDAIASLAIIAVNIAGGLAVGILRRGMSAAESIDTYGRLTVGDGLVTLIPAVLVSTAAGLLVTRVGQHADDVRLGEQVGRQLLAEPRALSAAAVLMLVLAVVPGLPAWPFLLLGALTGGGGLYAVLVRRRGAARSDGVPAGVGGSSLDAMQALMDRVAEEQPVLVRETVPRVASLPLLADLLEELRRDLAFTADDLPQVLEALARQRPGLEFEELLQRVRRRLAPVISGRLAPPGNGPIRVAVLGEELDAVVRSGLAPSSAGFRLALSAADIGQVVDELDRGLAAAGGAAGSVLLVGQDQRRELARLLRARLPGLIVLAHGELDDEVPLEVVARI